jgi:hypothetical protein
MKRLTVLSVNDKFESLARNLIERETLDAEEIKILMAGGTLPPMTVNKGSKLDKVADDDMAEPAEVTE